MPGFLAEISLKQGKVAKNFNLTFDSGLMVESLEEKHYYIERRTIKNSNGTRCLLKMKTT